MNSILTVSQLNSYIAFKLKDDYRLRGIFIQGEISNFIDHKKTGHFYFTLKDNNSSIKAIMFSSNACNLSFIPQNGMNVIVSASVQVFERDGLYQLYVTDIQPSGLGDLYLAFEQLKEKLYNENLFADEYKKPIPRFPKKIGVVTAKGGAAYQDILNIISRRYPIGQVLLFPTLVQGVNAPLSIKNAIEKAQDSDCDVLIVGRGGGSFEDLNAYNSEIVARAIFSSNIPVISAVGHETDTTIADFVSDLRAPTPSAAAELVAPDKEYIYNLLINYKKQLNNNILNIINTKENIIKSYAEKISPKFLENRVNESEKKLEYYKEKLYEQIKKILTDKKNTAEQVFVRLESINPENIIKRGYSLVYKNDTLIKSINKTNKGELIKIQLSDGFVFAEVKEILKGEDNGI